MVSAKSKRGADLEKIAPKPGRWLVPGEACWEIRESGAAFDFTLVRAIDDIDVEAPVGISLVALSPRQVTCQLFWLDTTDEKAVPDLLAMQGERRALLRQGDVWQHRIVRREADRLLAQVLILQNTIPEGLQAGGTVRFEALPRCLDLPHRSVCLWRVLGMMALAITDDNGLLYFQSLPHRTLTPECCRDVQSVVWIATAQGWAESLESIVLMGEWGEQGEEEACLLGSVGLTVKSCAAPPFAFPTEAMELVPAKVQHLRAAHRRSRQIARVAFAVAAVYLLFLFYQIALAITNNVRHRQLQAEFAGMLPGMNDLQNTARRIDTLNPAIDTQTYPMEILRRIMALLPESGVRLTRFEIIGDRIELSGESSTAREAFDFLHALQSAEALSYITWEDPPQPVPLPNDTTRFSIKGSITGAYHDAEES